MKSKNIKALVAIVIALLLMIVGVVGCSDEIPSDNLPETPAVDEEWHGNWERPDVEPEVPSMHMCEHACAVCEKCLDPDCKDEKCAEKCYETDSDKRTEYTFDGIDSRVLKEGGVRIENDHLANLSGNANTAITYCIISPANTTVCMGATVSEMKKTNFVTTETPITVNDVPFYSKAEVKKGDTVWSKFVTSWLGCVNLREGENYIKLTNPNALAAYNFKNLKFYSPVMLKWATEAHECTSKNEAGKCTDYTCNKAACLEKDETDWKKLNIYGKDDEVLKYYMSNGVAKDLWNDNEGEKCIGQIADKQWEQTVIWSFAATEETWIRLSLETSTNLNDYPFTDVWNMTFNGKPIVTEGATVPPAEGKGNWTTYTFGTVAYVKANAGENTFMMVKKNVKQGYNLRSLDISYESGTITKTQAAYPEDDLPITEGTESFFEGETAVMHDGARGAMTVKTDDALARNQTSIQNISGNGGASLTFTVHAEESCKAGLYVNLAFPFTTTHDIFTLTVNGKVKAIPQTFNAGNPKGWDKFYEYWLANVDLDAGDNTIILTVIEGEGNGGCGNFDYLKLVGPVAVTATNAA